MKTAKDLRQRKRVFWLIPVTWRPDNGEGRIARFSDVLSSKAFPSLPFGNRHITNNRLTSLEVGVFGKNTRLYDLYVDRRSGGESWAVR